MPVNLAAEVKPEAQEKRKRSMPTPVVLGLVAHPIVFGGLMLASWPLAVSQLGQDPIPYQHDPQFLSAPVSQFNALWLVLLLAALPAIPISVASAAGRWSTEHRWLSFAPLAAWAAAFLVIAGSWDVFVWFLD